MAMKVVVESTQVEVKSGVSQKNGKPYEIREQRALIVSDRLRGEVKLLLEKDQAPYAVGDYVFDLERSIYIGSFQSLRFAPVLVPAGGSSVRSVSSAA